MPWPAQSVSARNPRAKTHNGGRFDARKFGDQIVPVVLKETVRFSRNKRNNLARIHRACGGMSEQNCLATASDLDERQGGEPLAVIFVP